MTRRRLRDRRPSGLRRSWRFWTGGLVAAGTLFASSGGSDAATLYALVDTGEIFASLDDGTTWAPRAALPVPDVVSLIAGATPDVLLLATRSGTIYRSEDAGGAWAPIGSVGDGGVVDIAGRTDGALLVLTLRGAIWISEDGGSTFDLGGTIPHPDCRSLTRSDGGLFYALTETGTVLESPDGVVAWIPVGGVPVSDAVEVRTGGGILFLLTGTGAVFRSDAGARSWSPAGTTSQVGMTGLAVSGSELVAAHRSGDIARSEAGAAWSWTGSVQQVRTEAISNDVPQTTAAPAPPATSTRPRLRVWPNPTLPGSPLALDLATQASAGPWTVQLFEGTGRLVSRSDLSSPTPGESSTLRWRPPALIAGTYLIRASGPSGRSLTTKLVVLE